MPLSKYLAGLLTGFGVLVAAVVAVADQVTKLLILLMFGVAGPGRTTMACILDLLTVNAADVHVFRRVPVAPVLDLVLTWNTGISYGLFPQVGPVGQWALLAVKAVAVVLLWIWLSHASSRLTALALGLIIGGAVGNAVDRVLHGAVVDFVLFHLVSHEWYVFNLADSAIVAGVMGLLYESTFTKVPQKRPDP
jgi:signal peptidase II